MKNTQKGKQPASSAMSASRKGVAVTRFKKRKGLAMKGGKSLSPHATSPCIQKLQALLTGGGVCGLFIQRYMHVVNGRCYVELAASICH